MNIKRFPAPVATRRVGEEVRTCGDILLELVRPWTSHQVRLGIEASDQVWVLRSKLYDEPPDIGDPSLKGLAQRIWRGNK